MGDRAIRETSCLPPAARRDPPLQDQLKAVGEVYRTFLARVKEGYDSCKPDAQILEKLAKDYPSGFASLAAAKVRACCRMRSCQEGSPSAELGRARRPAGANG